MNLIYTVIYSYLLIGGVIGSHHARIFYVQLWRVRIIDLFVMLAVVFISAIFWPFMKDDATRWGS